MKNKYEDPEVRLIPFTVNSESRASGNKSLYGIEMINAKSMWQNGSQGEKIKIAVIDSGCDINHINLKENIVDVRNFTDEDNKNIVTDRVGHGTHVIGTICANGINNVFGVAPKSEIYVLKAINRTGSGKVSWIVSAINYAIEKKVDIISMSLGTPQKDPKLEKAVKEAVNRSILVVCAAGNEGDGNGDEFEYSYPASYSDVISVGAVDKKEQPASFSNSNTTIDLLAPGVEILSTYPGNQYAYLSGTSMATPHVTGSLALLKNWGRKEFQRELSQEEIYAQLIKSTKELGFSKSVEGNGLLKLKKEKTNKKNKY